jgi:hypothetical protein
VPLLIPARLRTVDLDEPNPLVFRFDALDGGFVRTLEAALDTPPDYTGARPYREKCAWDRVARSTAEIYRNIHARMI